MDGSVEEACVEAGTQGRTDVPLHGALPLLWAAMFPSWFLKGVIKAGKAKDVSMWLKEPGAGKEWVVSPFGAKMAEITREAVERLPNGAKIKAYHALWWAPSGEGDDWLIIKLQTWFHNHMKSKPEDNELTPESQIPGIIDAIAGRVYEHAAFKVAEAGGQGSTGAQGSQQQPGVEASGPASPDHRAAASTVGCRAVSSADTQRLLDGSPVLAFKRSKPTKRRHQWGSDDEDEDEGRTAMERTAQREVIQRVAADNTQLKACDADLLAEIESLQGQEGPKQLVTKERHSGKRSLLGGITRRSFPSQSVHSSCSTWE